MLRWSQVCAADPRRRWCVVGLSAAVVLGASSSALLGLEEQAEQARTVVAGYERLRAAGTVGDAALGEILLGELNCLSCHVPGVAGGGVAERIDTKPAPDLRRIGQRATPGWIRKFIDDPQASKPGTTMPQVLHGFAPAERARMADDLTHFLVAQSRPGDPPTFAPFRFRTRVEHGRELFHSVGCVACHAIEGAITTTTPSVPLPDLAGKTHVSALAEFLLDPEATRYSSRMPSLHLSASEATDIAIYLLREQEPQRTEYRPGFEFEYYVYAPQDADSYSAFVGPPPDLDAEEPIATGRIGRLSLQLPIVMNRGDHSYRYSGLIRIEQADRYSFTLRSDRSSASALTIDGNPVATKNGDSVRESAGQVELTTGVHTVQVTYYLRGRPQNAYLGVTVQGGGLPEVVDLERLAVFESIVLQPATSPAWQVDFTKAARGRQTFAAVGCAACHALASAPTDITARYSATPIERLEPAAIAAGENHIAEGSPSYRLDRAQRAAISAALADPARLATPRGNAAQITHTLATYNCYACHSRTDDNGELGGPDAERRGFFRVVGNQDLGDEGRFPPALTRIGGKLKEAALASILREDRLHIRRGYMHTRMPSFAGERLAELPALFDAVDATEGDLVEAPLSEMAIEDGLRLVGSEGLRCITCHDVGDAKTFGISVANLTRAYDRLRPGWLDRFLRDPGAIKVRTRMPRFWSDEEVILEDIAGGTTQGQIDAIWSYLSLGTSMPMPPGMDLGDALVLVPEEHPLVFRTFMSGASPRAIAIGYPEGVHAAFDANMQRLVKVWRGGFFDAKGTWSGRAGQFFGPYSDDVLEMPPGPAIAVLDTPEAPWPQALLTDRNLGGEFRGYRFDDDRRPVFRYVLNEVDINEQLVPVVRAGGANFIRRFTLNTASAEQPLYLLAAEGAEIIGLEDGTWAVDGRHTVSLSSNHTLVAVVRFSQGAAQLLVSIPVGENEPVTIDLEIKW